MFNSYQQLKYKYNIVKANQNNQPFLLSSITYNKHIKYTQNSFIHEEFVLKNWLFVYYIIYYIKWGLRTFRTHFTRQGSKKTFFMDKPLGCGLWKWTSPNLFQTSPKKIHLTKSHIKVLLVDKLWFWWVHYHLRTVIRNPRRNVQLTMGQIKCKQSTSFYALQCIN